MILNVFYKYYFKKFKIEKRNNGSKRKKNPKTPKPLKLENKLFDKMN